MRVSGRGEVGNMFWSRGGYRLSVRLPTYLLSCLQDAVSVEAQLGRCGGCSPRRLSFKDWVRFDAVCPLADSDVPVHAERRTSRRYFVTKHPRHKHCYLGVVSG